MGGQRPEATAQRVSRVVSACDVLGLVEPEPAPVVIIHVHPPELQHLWPWDSRSDDFMKPIFNMESQFRDIEASIETKKNIFCLQINQIKEDLESSRVGLCLNPWTKYELLLLCKNRLFVTRRLFIKSLDSPLRTLRIQMKKINTMGHRVKLDRDRKEGPEVSRIPDPKICQFTREFFLERAFNLIHVMKDMVDDVAKEVRFQVSEVMRVVVQRMKEADHREKELKLRKKKLKRQRSALSSSQYFQ